MAVALHNRRRCPTVKRVATKKLVGMLSRRELLRAALDTDKPICRCAPVATA